MAKVLLISTKDIKVNTFVDGNLDANKILQFVSIAQDIHLQSFLGTDLLDKLIADAPNFTGDYITLMEYVKPVLVHWSLTEYLPFSNVSLSNQGTFKNSVENTETLSGDELIELLASQKHLADYYSTRLVTYLCNNSELFPEYITNTDEDVKPSREGSYSNWVL